jgi:hypothetical protein
MANKKNNQPKKTRKVTKVSYTKRKPKDWFKVLLVESAIKTENGHSVVYPKVCETTLPECIEKMPKNRDVLNSGVKVIGGSVFECGYILRYPVVILFNGHYYIVDGQHLLRFCAEQKLPTRFFLCEVKSMQQGKDIMRLMNSCSRNWTLLQYIIVGAENGNGYEVLLDLLEKYELTTGITPNLLGAMMYNKLTTLNVGYSNQAIKRNSFKEQTDRDLTIQRLEGLRKFYDVTKMTKSQYSNWGLLNLMYDKQDTYFKNEKKFLKSVREYAVANQCVSETKGRTRDYQQMFAKCWDNM